MKGRVFEKTEITDDERAEDDAFKRMPWEQQLEYRKTQIKTYRKGDSVKAVLGGYRGPYIYGYVENIGETYVEFRPLDSPSSGFVVARPDLCSGLKHVSAKEMDEAIAYFKHK